MATKKVTYKEAILEIEEILKKIENEELDVDELSEQVNRVSVLIGLCKDKLHKTEAEVEKILNEMDSWFYRAANPLTLSAFLPVLQAELVVFLLISARDLVISYRW